MRKSLCLVWLTCLAAPLVMAADDSESHHPQPPAAAFTACEGKSAGDQVSLTGPDGNSRSATCREVDGKLAAMPKNMGKGGRPMGPPPEAVTACTGKSAGDSVSFKTADGKSLSGTCHEVDGKLAAMPEHSHTKAD